jgi:indole-3-glycerol phosphate synthase
MPVIAELKPRTPAAGDLLRGRKGEDVVRSYEQSGAACLSVVTGPWFGGSAALLARIARITTLPILRKDFLPTRAALARSQDLGAAAVLLTRQLVTLESLRALVEYALSIELTPFIEVASAQEVAELYLDRRVIIAVNNKDIARQESFGEGIARSLRLLERARATGAGAVVSASAIESPCAARQLIDAGFDGLLVGTAFLAAPDLDQRLQEFCSALVGAP